MRRLLLLLVLLVLAPRMAQAQIAGPPNVFVNGTTIDADEVNANFAAVYSAACNRTGCTMTGPLLFSADNNHDIGASGTTRPRDLHLARNAIVGGTLAVTGASTFTGATTFAGAMASSGGLTITSVTAPQFAVRYDASNRLALSVSSAGAVSFDAVGAGAAIAFSDAVTVPAFTATGFATFSGGTTTLTGTAPNLRWQESGVTADNTRWRGIADAQVFSFQACDDAESVCNSAWNVSRANAVVAALTVGAAQLLLPASTAAVPALAPAADPDTGVYGAGTNILGITTAGTARWTFDASGHFVPAANNTYNVGSSTLGVRQLILAGGTNTTPGIGFAADAGQDSGIYYDTGTSTLQITVNSSNAWAFGASTADFSGELNVNGVDAGAVRIGATTFANLASSFFGATNGSILYCSDCGIANPCAGAGTGAIAKRLNGVWVCN